MTSVVETGGEGVEVDVGRRVYFTEFLSLRRESDVVDCFAS